VISNIELGYEILLKRQAIVWQQKWAKGSLQSDSTCSRKGIKADCGDEDSSGSPDAKGAVMLLDNDYGSLAPKNRRSTGEAAFSDRAIT
jgi:hypothetical protein